MDERWAFRDGCMNVSILNLVRLDGPAARRGTHSTVHRDNQVGASETVSAKSSVIDP